MTWIHSSSIHYHCQCKALSLVYRWGICNTINKRFELFEHFTFLLYEIDMNITWTVVYENHKISWVTKWVSRHWSVDIAISQLQEIRCTLSSFFRIFSFMLPMMQPSHISTFVTVVFAAYSINHFTFHLFLDIVYAQMTVPMPLFHVRILLCNVHMLIFCCLQ